MVTATGTVVKGNLIINRVADFYKRLDIFDGQEIEIEVRKKIKKRSSNQNKFYWGVILPALKIALEDVGIYLHSNDQVHDLLKFKFLRMTSANEDTGEEMEYLGTTTEMSTSEFEIFLTNVRAWAAEYLSTELPIPNE